jgi:hypothetical protein
VPALRTLSPSQRSSFLASLGAFARRDGIVTLHEFVLAELLAYHLGLLPDADGKPSAKEIADAVAQVLAAVARAGASDETAAREAYVAAHGGDASPMPAASAASRWPTLHAALRTCRAAAPAVRRDLVDAAAREVANDGVVSADEADLLRLVADVLDCPVPPLAGLPTS